MNRTSMRLETRRRLRRRLNRTPLYRISTTEAGPAVTTNYISERTDPNDSLLSTSLIDELNTVESSQDPTFEISPTQEPETTATWWYTLSQGQGLSEGIISKYLKTMSVDEIRDKDIDGDRKICAVCRDDMCGSQRDDKVAILDNCGHEFHYCCLEEWLRKKNVCPLCRSTAIFLLQD
ncbi:hypothetical protein CASFOL_026539 [Castilleja foliolosa]|uniref:RING-type E3 ubiquitin transferase n=1 Tax=Castilleja foliolosa TaxID=1961234 RepID=A0ABD3CIL1_9LAMI